VRRRLKAATPPPAPSLGADAIKPHWLERQSDHRSPAFVARGDADGVANVTSRNWTTVGTVGSASTTRAIVDPRGLASAAFLFPLAHRQTLRVVVPHADEEVEVDVDSLPDLDLVVRSWHAQTTSRGLHLALPEGRLAAAVDANRRSLLLAPAHPAVVVALDHHGFHKDSADALRSCTGRKAALDTSLLPAMTEHWRLSGSLDAIDGETVVRLVRAIQREDRDADGLVDAASLVRAFGLDPLADECERWSPSRPAPPARPLQGDGGIDVLATLRRAAEELAAGDRAALERLSWLLDVASPTWAWPSFVHPTLGTGCGGDGHDGRVSAAFLSFVRGLLVRETADDGLALCSMLPDAWIGQALEVHDAPTRYGKVSFAVRYHGERPALLWDLKARAGAPPVPLTAPGLDPAWSSTDAKGEALLAAAPGATPVVAIPAEGSFS
jgi:hypothetical protein